MPRCTTDTFIEGAVSAAGVDAEFLIGGFGFSNNLFCGVLWPTCDIDLEAVLPCSEGPFNAATQISGGIAASCNRIDNKQMFHFQTQFLVRVILKLLFKIHEQIALDHAIVKLPLFVGGLSKEVLKLRMGGEKIK